MPISTFCGDCQKKYTVKDEMAGKRFRCKDCQSIVTVPDAPGEVDEDDPFSGVDLKSAGAAIRKRRHVEDDDDDDEGDDENENPYRSPRSKSKPVKKKKRSRGPGMPATAIIAIVLQCLIVLLHVVNCLLVFIGEDDNGAHKTGTIIGALFRFTIAVSILTGLLQRKDNSRQWSRGLSILGLVVGGLAWVVLIAVGPKTDENIGIIIVLTGQLMIWVGIIICLSTESAADWFNE